MPTELSPALASLAAELDALGAHARQMNAPTPESAAPDFQATDFRLENEIGRGGMGVVYKARQISLDRPVAIKVLAPTLLNDPAFRARLVQESHLIAQLHHPNIIDVYAAGTCGTNYYFAMEYVEGTTARDFVFRDLRAIATFGIRIAEALAYAHSCGILHRDIKPANILLTDGSARVKIGDFGLACLVENAAGVSGTRPYMAPELLHGEGASIQTDIFALGATLREEATPFLQEKPDRDFLAILAKAQNPQPNLRYATMGELTDDLRHWLNHEPITAAPPSWARRLKLWGTRNPAAALSAAFALLLALGLFAALTVGYLRTSAALRQVEHEAVNTAAALVSALTATEEDRLAPNKRLAKLQRACETLEKLQARFPQNTEIAHALERLSRATDFTAQKEREGRARPALTAPDGPRGTLRPRNPMLPRDLRHGTPSGNSSVPSDSFRP